MKKDKKHSANKRTFAIVIHKDGASTRIVMYGVARVKLCFVTLEYYYDRIRPSAAGISLYIVHDRARLKSIYTHKKRKIICDVE